MTQLLDLPSELIAYVFGHLEDADFFATRSASKSLESASLTVFGRRFFRKKGYMITTTSLDVLRSVADSSKLRKYVQHVWFNPDCYTFITPSCAPELDINCDDAEDSSEDENVDITLREETLSPEDQEKWQTYGNIMHDHISLLDGGAENLQSRLEQVLRQLPNVKILGMRRSEDHNPWGWRQLKNSVGEDPRILGPIPSQPAYGLSDSTRLFAAMASAVAATEIRLQRFYTDAVEVDNLPMHRLPERILQPALRSMLYLEINVSKAWLAMRSSPHHRVLRDEGTYGDGLLRVFQAAAPTLLELGLQIFPEMGRTRPQRSYDVPYWKTTYPYLTFQKVVDNVQFEQLTRLKLEKIVAMPSALEAFLSPSKQSLASLKMRDIRLLQTEEISRPWEPMLAFLYSSIPNLGYLLLHQLSHATGKITFEDPSAARAALIGPNANVSSSQNPRFTEYEHVTLEAKTRGEVLRRLQKVKDKHWYAGSVYTYPMDDEVWHTDTSDEEW